MTDKELIKQESEDLEESAKYYSLNTHTSPLNNILHQADLKVEIQYHKDIKDAYKAGAEWQKQQMMKDAVEATLLDVNAQTVEFGLWPEKLLSIKEGDKVKIIIIKEK